MPSYKDPKTGLWHAVPRSRLREDWTPEEDALLGTAKDVDLKATLGRSVASIKARRELFGVAVFRGHPTQHAGHAEVMAAWRACKAVPAPPSSSPGNIVSLELIKAMAAASAVASGRYLGLLQRVLGESLFGDAEEEGPWPSDPYDDPTTFGMLLVEPGIVEFLLQLSNGRSEYTSDWTK